MKRALPLIALLLATCAIATPDPARVERLTRELSKQRPRRIQALWELYRMGPNAKSATPALLKALYNEELEDVPLVMSALVAIAPEDLNVVRELSERTKYDTTAIRLRAEYLLSKVAARPSKARDTLFLAFGRDRALSQLLLDLGPAPAPDLFSKMLRMPTEEHGAWLNLFRVYGQQPYAPEVTDMLVTQMASKDPKRVDLAVTILQQFGQQSEGAVTALNAYVVSTDTPERTILGCTTLATAGAMGVPGIVRALHQANENTQLQLVSILEFMGPVASPAAGSLREIAKKSSSGILRVRIQSALHAISR